MHFGHETTLEPLLHRNRIHVSIGRLCALSNYLLNIPLGFEAAVRRAHRTNASMRYLITAIEVIAHCSVVRSIRKVYMRKYD